MREKTDRVLAAALGLCLLAGCGVLTYYSCVLSPAGDVTRGAAARWLGTLCVFLGVAALSMTIGRKAVAGRTLPLGGMLLCFGIWLHSGAVLTPAMALTLALGAAALACLELEELREHTRKTPLMPLEFLPLVLAGATACLGCRTGDRVWNQLSALLFAMTAVLLVLDLFARLRHMAEIAAQQETALTRRQVSVALNHLQPHFLYNALNAIQYLCEEEPLRAESAIGAFAGFLRGNMDSLRLTEPIPFERELQHLKSYLSLEILRFGDRVRVDYDIQVTGFLLPALTLQPMVENAIRFGITKKPGGGTVRVSTREDELDYQVIIDDDGTGFDPRTELEESRSHIDVRDVETRLSRQCDGRLEIDCRPGEGTTVTLFIPKASAAQNPGKDRRTKK